MITIIGNEKKDQSRVNSFDNIDINDDTVKTSNSIMRPYKAIIASDLHLGTRDSQAKEFIEFLETHPTELLILNGDIIDGWALNRGSKWKKQHTKAISYLLKLSNKTKIIWIRGNHDEFLTEYIGAHFGNIEVREDYILHTKKWITGDNFEQRNYYIFHGDVIDIFIAKYTWLAKIGSVGYDLALWCNYWYNRYRAWRKLPYQSISQNIKAAVKTAVSYVNDFEVTAIKMAHKHGCYGVICGHIHQPADRLINNAHYLNTGDWVENRTAILLDWQDNFSTFTL
jgi:UDP-2,3-diacylglucosamine pyrophosphatase LpxH